MGVGETDRIRWRNNPTNHQPAPTTRTAPRSKVCSPTSSGWLRRFWVSRQRNKLLTLAGGLIAVVGATAYMQIRLNSWNRPFYNALTNKDMPGFLDQLGVFGEHRGDIAHP